MSPNLPSLLRHNYWKSDLSNLSSFYNSRYYKRQGSKWSVPPLQKQSPQRLPHYPRQPCRERRRVHGRLAVHQAGFVEQQPGGVLDQRAVAGVLEAGGEGGDERVAGV